MLLQNRRTREKAPAINAGSMADIAFLLLIFFLVTTTIFEEKALKVKLPPWSDNKTVVPTNNALLNIKINRLGELLVEKEFAKLENLRALVKNFVRSPTRDDGSPELAGSGIISLQHEANASYGHYIAVYDELQAAFAEIHEEEANRRFKLGWFDLDVAQRNTILKEYPIKISEAEPFTNSNK